MADADGKHADQDRTEIEFWRFQDPGQREQGRDLEPLEEQDVSPLIKSVGEPTSDDWEHDHGTELRERDHSDGQWRLRLAVHVGAQHDCAHPLADLGNE